MHKRSHFSLKHGSFYIDLKVCKIEAIQTELNAMVQVVRFESEWACRFLSVLLVGQS